MGCGGVLPLCRGAVGIFYSPSQQSALCLSNSFNWVLSLMVISFVSFSFISLLISRARTGDLCHFSLVCSVILGFSSVLVLVFTLVSFTRLILFHFS